MGLVWMCTDYTWNWCGYAPMTRETCMDVHRLHVDLVWMCTDDTRDLYGCAPSTRGTGVDVHR